MKRDKQMAAADPTSERERVLQLLRRYGWNTTSFQLLEPEFHYWFRGDEACVAFVDTGGAYVVAGAPVCDERELGAVAEDFVRFARNRGRRAVFFAVEARFTKTVAMRALTIGQQPIWNPQVWAEGVRRHRSLREQLRRSRAKRVSIERVATERIASPDWRSEVGRLMQRWLSSRPMPRMAFLVDLDPFAFPTERRYWSARVDGALCGMLVAVPVFGRNGWFLEDLLRDPAAPNGTAELLFDAAMRDLAADGTEFATFGLAPLAGDVGILGVARRVMSSFYNFDGLYAFKAKLRPQRWEPVFLAVPRGGWTLVALWDSLSAFASGRPIRFGVSAIFRASTFMLRALALLLIPWTLLLVSPGAARYFPDHAAQLAWGAFDALVVLALLALARRWRKRLAVALAVAVTCDALLTIAQVSLFNAEHVKRWFDWPIAIVSMAAPLFAATFLWSGIRRRRK